MNIVLNNFDELRQRLAKIPNNINNEIYIALRKSVREIQNYARQHHRFRNSTGVLEHSIQTDVDRNSLSAEIFLNEANAPYGKFIHDGVNHSWNITPRFKQCLRWSNGSNFVFAKKVVHPPQKPDTFVYDAENAKRQEINDLFDRHINKAIEEAFR